jgi:hypothetical protein
MKADGVLDDEQIGDETYQLKRALWRAQAHHQHHDVVGRCWKKADNLSEYPVSTDW